MPKTLKGALNVIARRDATITSLKKENKDLKETIESKSEDIAKVNKIIMERNAEVDGLRTQVKVLKGQMQGLIDRVAAKIMSVADESEIMKTLERLLSVEDAVIKDKKEAEKAAKKREQELIEENNRLRKQVERLELEIKRVREENEAKLLQLEKRLGNIKQGIDTKDKEKADKSIFSRFRAVINYK